jgi:hypothetical protein
MVYVVNGRKGFHNRYITNPKIICNLLKSTLLFNIMDLPWGDPRSNKFATSIGLITSNGPRDHDILACEWTHHLSYRPGLIAVSLGPTKATVENIRSSREFGINLCATDQTIAASVAGGYSGRDYDKINALKDLDFSSIKEPT